MQVLDLYGDRIAVEPHHYVPGGHYLVFKPQDAVDQPFRLLFETDGHVVTEFRTGLSEPVSWVEGCA